MSGKLRHYWLNFGTKFFRRLEIRELGAASEECLIYLRMISYLLDKQGTAKISKIIKSLDLKDKSISVYKIIGILSEHNLARVNGDIIALNLGKYELLFKTTNAICQKRYRERLKTHKLPTAKKSLEAKEKNITTSLMRVEKHIPYGKIIEIYHKYCGKVLPTVTTLTSDRKAKIRQRWNNELPSLTKWEEYFRKVSESNWLMGRTEKKFRCSFDWLICPRNCVKVLEDNYSNYR